MDLLSVLLQRQMPKQANSTEQKRADTANAMSLAYANGWQPNPILIRLMNR